jgi:hypothetical protein
MMIIDTNPRGEERTEQGMGDKLRRPCKIAFADKASRGGAEECKGNGENVCYYVAQASSLRVRK